MVRMKFWLRSSRSHRAGAVTLACLGALALSLAQPRPAAATTVATVFAEYPSGADNTIFHIHNVSALDLTSVMLSGLGTSGSINGATGTKNLGTIMAGKTLDFAFADGSGVFAHDFDDHYTGAVSYTLTALWNGQSLSTTFSPSSNLSGKFVGFLGNSPCGSESDAPVCPTEVATLTASPAAVTPEPAGLALLATGGLPLLGLLRRRKA